MISAYRKRIEWGDNEAVILFPFPTANARDGRKSVNDRPKNLVGRLLIRGIGIVSETVAERAARVSRSTTGEGLPA